MNPSPNRSHILVSCLALLALALACSLPVTAPLPAAPTIDPRPAAATAVALTVQAGSNPNPQPGLVPVGTVTLGAPPPAAPTQPTQAQPTFLPPTAQPTLTATIPVPCDRAGFVKDVTISDGTKIKASETFNKTWRLRNDGSCSWNSAYAVIFERGEQMGAAAFTNFTAASIPPNQSVDVTVTLTAPNQPGTYQAYFMLKNASGGKFGIGNKGDQAFWVKIVVEGATGPTIYNSGLLTIPQTWTVDLDRGTLGPASGADIHYEVDIQSNHNLVFYGPAKLFVRQPTYEDCRDAQMDSPTVPISGLSLGTFYCYLTDQGRLGFLEYAGADLTPGAGKLYLEFTTWNKP